MQWHRWVEEVRASTVQLFQLCNYAGSISCTSYKHRRAELRSITFSMLEKVCEPRKVTKNVSRRDKSKRVKEKLIACLNICRIGVFLKIKSSIANQQRGVKFLSRGGVHRNELIQSDILVFAHLGVLPDFNNKLRRAHYLLMGRYPLSKLPMKPMGLHNITTMVFTYMYN